MVEALEDIDANGGFCCDGDTLNSPPAHMDSGSELDDVSLNVQQHTFFDEKDACDNFGDVTTDVSMMG